MFFIDEKICLSNDIYVTWLRRINFDKLKVFIMEHRLNCDPFLKQYHKY